jgi:hypothetical protein
MLMSRSPSATSESSTVYAEEQRSGLPKGSFHTVQYEHNRTFVADMLQQDVAGTLCPSAGS